MANPIGLSVIYHPQDHNTFPVTESNKGRIVDLYFYCQNCNARLVDPSDFEERDIEYAAASSMVNGATKASNQILQPDKRGDGEV